MTDLLNDSADIFANSSTETVTENIDYSFFLNENNGNNYKEVKVLIKTDKNQLNNHVNGPLFTSSPLTESYIAPLAHMSTTNTSMNVSFITNQFISDACQAPVVLYCPFCPDEFHVEFLLKEHIKAIHPNELKNVIRKNGDELVEFNPCPFCHATFYVKELLPKHIVKKHQDSIMSIFTDVNPDKYLNCPFCNYKVLTRHSKVLINHIEKKHAVEFHIAIKSKFSNAFLNNYELSYYDYKATNTSSDCLSLSKKMMGLSTSGSGIKPKRIKSILKKTTSYPEGLNMDDLMNDDDNLKELSTFSLNNSSFIERRSVRRRLRFELPLDESPSSDNDKENSIFNPIKKQNFSPGKTERKLSKWRNIFRLNKKKNKYKEEKGKNKSSPKDKSHSLLDKSTKSECYVKNKEIQTTLIYSSVGFKVEGVSQLAVMQFKCGLCFEGFNKNALLLEHLRRCHKGLKLIPQYRCGECDAKFFRNTFLVRHCWYHHTPRCLKTNTKENIK